MAPSEKASAATVAPNCRGRYTVEEVSPLNPANQPPPPSLPYRCACCLFDACRCLGRNFALAICGGGRGRRRTVALGGLAVLALVCINRLVMSPSMVGGEGHAIVLDQSYGLLEDVPRWGWERLRKDTKRQRGRQKTEDPSKYGMPAEFYERHWPAEFECPHEVRVGESEAEGSAGSGGWMLCHPRGIASASAARAKGGRGNNGCLVYVSTVADGGLALEMALMATLGGCEMHAFRPGGGAGPPGGTLHGWGFKGSQIDVQGDFKSMQETVKLLGHEGRTVDVFLLDCPGCEWDSYKDWFDSKVTFMQVLAKVHDTPPIVNDFFSTMQSQGYVTFHKEADEAVKGNNQYYSFLKLTPAFLN